MPSVFLLRRSAQALRSAESALPPDADGPLRWRCVGQSEHLHEAQAEIERLQPELLLSDLRLLAGHAAILLRRLRGPRPRVLLLTSLPDEPLLFETLRLGAHGYWADPGGAKGLGTALQEFQAGQAAMSPELARRTLQAFGLPRSELALAHCVGSAQDLTPARDRQGLLSRADQHLLSLVAQGLLSHEIAQRWQLAEAEIGRRLAAVYQALHRLPLDSLRPTAPCP